MTSFRRRAGGLAVVLVAFCGLQSGIAIGAADKEPVGYLAAVRGDVTVDGVQAKNGAKLYPNSRIKTGNGKATVLLAGESVIQMTYDSELEIRSVLKKPSQGVDADVDLEHGKVRALVRDHGVPKRFQIRTRSAVMGVRGTEVFIDAPKSGPAFFATVEGNATVTPVGPAGAPPAAPINLPQNQGFGSGGGKGLRNLSGQQTRELASSVSPPRAESLVVSDVLSSATHGSDAPAPPPAPPGQSTGPKLDPVANSTIATPISPSAILVPTSKKL